MENRDKRLWIRLTPAEHGEVRERAKEMGVSVSYYIRTRIFRAKEASVINAKEYLDAYREGVRELKKIGNNINQLARYANYINNSGQIQPAVIEELNSLLKEFVLCQRETADLDRKILKA
jgi:hypothetical protein